MMISYMISYVVFQLHDEANRLSSEYEKSLAKLRLNRSKYEESWKGGYYMSTIRQN